MLSPAVVNVEILGSSTKEYVTGRNFPTKSNPILKSCTRDFARASD